MVTSAVRNEKKFSMPGLNTDITKIKCILFMINISFFSPNARIYCVIHYEIWF